jgi:hypothetical protein
MAKVSPGEVGVVGVIRARGRILGSVAVAPITPRYAVQRCHMSEKSTRTSAGILFSSCRAFRSEREGSLRKDASRSRPCAKRAPC